MCRQSVRKLFRLSTTTKYVADFDSAQSFICICEIIQMRTKLQLTLFILGMKRQNIDRNCCKTQIDNYRNFGHIKSDNGHNEEVTKTS